MIREQDIFCVEEHTRPITTLSLTLRTGMLDDPPGKEGLAWLTGQMLLRGAGGLSHVQLTEELDFLGASLGVSVARDTTTFTGDVLLRNLDHAQALWSKVIAEPDFAEAELDKLKRQTLAELEQLRDHDSALAQRFFVREVFGTHPYGRPLKGTEASVSSITREDVLGFWRRHYRRTGALAGGASAINRARLVRFIEATIGRLDDEARPDPLLDVVTPPKGYGVVLVDKPERTQTQVYVGHPTLDANHPDYLPLFVGNVIFGGTFTARLSHEIREKRGWSYGAYSYLHCDRRLGTFMMRFYPSVKDTVPALRVADTLLADLRTGGVTAEELDATRSYLVNGHRMGFETPEKELHERLSARLVGRPDDWLDNFIPMIEAVRREDICRCLAEHLTPDDVVASVVCTAGELADDLAAWPRVSSVKVIDYRTP